ncbi:MAG TPA: cytochrome c oxidase subunit 3 [Candidatus Eisenbacteria bacterium]
MNRRELPWATEVRPDTGLVSSRLGLWLFMASETMLLAGLVSALFFLRLASDDWPREALEHGLPLVNSIVMASSALMLFLARRSLGVGSREFMLQALLGVALGFLVLFIRSAEWSILLGMGRTPAVHNLFGIYFVLTGVHAVLLAGNLAVLAWILSAGRTLAATHPARFRERAQGAVTHWHFLTLVWFVIHGLFFQS